MRTPITFRFFNIDTLQFVPNIDVLMQQTFHRRRKELTADGISSWQNRSKTVSLMNPQRRLVVYAASMDPFTNDQMAELLYRAIASQRGAVR